MTTPQDSPRRKKQKARRTKQLAAWRAKHPAESKSTSTSTSTSKKEEKPAAAKKKA